MPQGFFHLSKHIAGLQLAIELEHDCVAKPVVTMPVVVAAGRERWRGMVAAFDLAGHRSARRCYAWPVSNGHGLTTITQLKLPPIANAEDAVRSWLQLCLRNSECAREPMMVFARAS